MKLLLATACVWVICGVVIFVFAVNLWLLWALWLVALGILMGKVLSRKPQMPELVGGTFALLILGTVFVRGLPIHSVGWEGCSRITVSKLSENWEIELTDPGEIEVFNSYGRRGHYKTMVKSGYGYHLYVGDVNNRKGYYMHGFGIGDSSGGFVQSVFVPAKDGFRDFFEGVLKKHGHERK